MPDGSIQMNPLVGCELNDPKDRALRNAFGRFATGVTVVTAATSSGPIGMTANSFTSVSLDPPLVLWCAARSSARYAAFAEAKHFAIHVLGAHDKALALAFAKREDAFENVDLDYTELGIPVFDQCLARFECTTQQIHDAGDHALIVGQVRSASLREGEGLVFSQGSFGQFDKEA